VLGTSEQWLNHREAAVQLQREAYETYLRRLGPRSDDTAHAAQTLGQGYEVLGRYDDAERMYRAALAGFQASLGEQHSATGLSHLDLGGLLDRVGRHDEGDAELQTAIATLRKVFGPDHPQVAGALFSRGILLMGLHRWDEAATSFRETLRIYRPDTIKAAQSQRYLGVTLMNQQRWADSEASLQAALAVYAHQSVEDAQRWRVVADLGTLKLRTGDAAGAVKLLRQAVANVERLVGGESYDVRTPLKRLGQALLLDGDAAEAVATLERVQQLEIKLFGGDKHRDVAATRTLLAEAQLALGTAQARTQARATVDQAIDTRRLHPDVDDLGSALLLRARIALAHDDAQQAQKDVLEALPLLPHADPIEGKRQAQALLAQAHPSPALADALALLRAAPIGGGK
jgi:tetratricopeptide (TPR) repeat protein